VDYEHCSTFSLIVQGLPIINVTLLATEIMEFTSLYEIDIVKQGKNFSSLLHFENFATYFMKF
jgi:hypothetical protein